MNLWMDFETYSEVNIKLSGGYRYCKDESTKVICLGWAIDDGPVELWVPGHPLPAKIIEAIHNDCPVLAHNALFDYRIWNNILCRDFQDLPFISIYTVVDTAGLGASFALPASLENAGTAMNIEMPKDISGKMLIKLLCTPDVDGNRPMPDDLKYAEKFKEFYAYCIRDVEAMREFVQSLPRDEMTNQEARIWRLTQRMNTRGLPVAYDEAKAVKEYLDAYVKVAMLEVPKITMMPVEPVHPYSDSTDTGSDVDVEMKPMVQTINQIAKIRDWCVTQAYPLLDMTAATVEQCLADEQCPPKVRQLLTLRQELGKTSTAKYKKILDLACPGQDDSYWVHDNLVYHGAAPGRWTGRGFQMHNLPRASVPNPEEVIAHFKARSKTIKDPVMMGKALIRPMIKAPKGSSIIVSDYSSIENRVLHWLAGDIIELENFRNGLDQYKTMAASLYNIPYDDVDSDQRKMGKVIILGCIAEGTLVLTGEGPVPIEDITLEHEVWDGGKWVAHQGLLDKGYKDCLEFAGIWMTPDHEVYFEHRKEAVWAHYGSIKSEKRAICSAFGKFLDTHKEMILDKQLRFTAFSASCASENITTLWRLLKTACRFGVDDANELWNLWGLIQRVAIQLLIDLERYGQKLNLVAMIRKIDSISGMGNGGQKCSTYGSKILMPLFSMLLPSQVARLQAVGYTGLTSVGIIPPETSHSIPQKLKSFDLLNSGDLHRFTVLTSKGPLVVSNCGYMMGAETFQKTAKTQFKMDLSEKKSIEAVKAYRAKYDLVVDLWSMLKKAAIRTVISGQKNTYGLITFGTATVKGVRWLAMQLPNDKCIYYKNPMVEQKHIPKFEHMGPVATITHEGWNGYSRKWTRLILTPGRITENADQGTAREMMATGLLNIQDRMPEVKLIGTVHDEALGLIKNNDIQSDTMERFDRLMCEVSWAEGCPIVAKGYIANRYRKE